MDGGFKRVKKKYLTLFLIAVFGASFYGGYWINQWVSDVRAEKEKVMLGSKETAYDLEEVWNKYSDLMGNRNEDYRKLRERLYGSNSNNNDNGNSNGNSNNGGNNGTTPGSNVDVGKLSTAEKAWYYIITKDGRPSEEPQEVKDLIKRYNAYYLGKTTGKYIYLTFDEGYENGYTPKILDTLKDNNVKAAFFVTTPYIKENKELVKRMVNEGHLVCNHSTTHPSMPAIRTETAFQSELARCEEAFEQVTGKKLARFFRPPMGNYSELSLYYTDKLGYKTIFWSFAYNDWDVNSQPSIESAKKIILDRTHGGGIYLLHAVSKTNTDILDWVIKEWKNKGYDFKSLNEI